MILEKNIKNPFASNNAFSVHECSPSQPTYKYIYVVRQDDPSHPKDVIAAEGHKHKKQFSHEKDSIIIQCGSAVLRKYVRF